MLNKKLKLISTSRKWHYIHELTLNAPIATKVVCFSHLLKCLRSLYGKQCGPRSDCSYRSSLVWVHTVCFYTQFVSNARQLFAADDFSRRHFQMHFFLGALRLRFIAIAHTQCSSLSEPRHVISTMWHFDNYTLRKPCAAPYYAWKLQMMTDVQSVAQHS